MATRTTSHIALVYSYNPSERRKAIMSPSLSELYFVEAVPLDVVEKARILFLAQTEKHFPWAREPLPENERLLSEQVFCTTFPHEDGMPALCDCDRAKDCLGLPLHRCNPNEPCVVRVVLYPHKFGGKRRQ